MAANQDGGLETAQGEVQTRRCANNNTHYLLCSTPRPIIILFPNRRHPPESESEYQARSQRIIRSFESYYGLLWPQSPTFTDFENDSQEVSTPGKHLIKQFFDSSSKQCADINPLVVPTEMMRDYKRVQADRNRLRIIIDDPMNENKLASSLICPVCYDVMASRIFQCREGHLLCGCCYPYVDKCPLCRAALSQFRNRGMENVSKTLILSCKYKPYGCEEVSSLVAKEKHEQNCEFRAHMCPLSDESCDWQGSLREVTVHIQQIHLTVAFLEENDMIFLASDINVDGNFDWHMVQHCFDQFFLVVLDKATTSDGEVRYFLSVRLIGSQKDANKFLYRVKLSREGRCLQWESTPWFTDEEPILLSNFSDCLVLNKEIIDQFKENGNLSINVQICLRS